MKKFFISVFVVFVLAGCQKLDAVHEHTFSSEYKYNSDSHWHSAICEHEEIVSGLENHTLIIPIDNSENIAACKCGYKKSLKEYQFYDDLLAEIESLKKSLEEIEEKNNFQDSILEGNITKKIFFDENDHWKYQYENGELVQIVKENHFFDTPMILKESTCEEKGNEKYSCVVCDYSYEKETDKLPFHLEIYKYLVGPDGEDIYRETYCSITYELLNKKFFKKYIFDKCELLSDEFTTSETENIFKEHIFDIGNISRYDPVGPVYRENFALGNSKCPVCGVDYIGYVPCYIPRNKNGSSHIGYVEIRSSGFPYFMPHHICDTRKINYNGKTYNVFVCQECNDINQASEKPSETGAWVFATSDGSEIKWDPEATYHPADCECETRIACYKGQYFFVFLCIYCSKVQCYDRPIIDGSIVAGDWTYDSSTDSFDYVEIE